MCQIAIGKGHFCFLSKSSLKKEKKSDKNTPKRYYESDISIPFFLSLFLPCTKVSNSS